MNTEKKLVPKEDFRNFKKLMLGNSVRLKRYVQFQLEKVIHKIELKMQEYIRFMYVHYHRKKQSVPI